MVFADRAAMPVRCRNRAGSRLPSMAHAINHLTRRSVATGRWSVASSCARYSSPKGRPLVIWAPTTAADRPGRQVPRPRPPGPRRPGQARPGPSPTSRCCRGGHALTLADRQSEIPDEPHLGPAAGGRSWRLTGGLVRSQARAVTAVPNCRPTRPATSSKGSSGGSTLPSAASPGRGVLSASVSATPSSHPAGGGAMTPSTTQALTDEGRRALMSTMVLIRTYEEAIRAAYYADKLPAFDIGAGLVPGEMHLSAGQEPVAAGICAHLTPQDALTATHRPHHLAIAHGVALRPMTAEIFGRESGFGHGRGGHMHLFDPSTHFSCSGIIAEGLPPALGQAFAFQRQSSDRVAVAVTGEGAANQGAFHESLNLAALWKLPVVFVVEDNDWGISVPRSHSTSVASNAERAAAYGMPGVRVEDNSVEAIYAP